MIIELLIRTSEILKESCRSEDIIARWGGDEKIAIGTATKDNYEAFLEETFKKAEDRMYQNKLTETNSARSDIISALLATLKEKSDETEEHAVRMMDLGFKFGHELGLSIEELDKLSLLATMHDIGKVTIPEETLKKPGRLTEHECEKVKEHPETGQRIARTSENLIHIADEILCYHERWDGKGYPRGLKGTEVPYLARILPIIDAYDVIKYLAFVCHNNNWQFTTFANSSHD